MERIEEILDGVKTMGIGGHVRPDGDCVGSCLICDFKRKVGDSLIYQIYNIFHNIIHRLPVYTNIFWRSRNRYSDILHAWTRCIMKQASPESMIFL